VHRLQARPLSYDCIRGGAQREEYISGHQENTALSSCSLTYTYVHRWRIKYG